MTDKQFVMLSGLPRTGSTLLSAILSQNPKIHSEGNSGLCSLMWDMQTSFNTTVLEQIKANNRHLTQKIIISALPDLYYNNIESPIIIDKCRSWTFPENIDMIHNYITTDVKIIVMHRPIKEIIKSFVRLRIENKMEGDLISDLLIPGSEPVLRSFSGIINGNRKYKHIFLHINYEDLINDFDTTITKIYKFCNWEEFLHNKDKIELKHKEDDSVYGLKGFHDIRPSLSKLENPINLPKEVEYYCDMLDMMIKNTIEV